MINTKVARRVLNNVVFPGEADPTHVFCLSKTKRKNAILSRDKHCKVAAVIQIQSAWKGHRTRCKLKAIFAQHDPSGQSTAATAATDQSVGSLYPKLKSRYKDYLRWCFEQNLQSSVILSFEDYCARIIQLWWRRLRLKNVPVRPIPSRVPRVCKSLLPRRKLDPHTAAVLIQRVWRKHNDAKVYRFYRDLINFKRRGNPKMMLRCINPAEAKLLDKAIGAHVKFRLGGVNFPPNIYYKVFTCRPIVDLCACSPRDYTAMVSKQKLPRDLHNHTHEVPDNKKNWYKRYENNGWRPVSDRLFLNTQMDPVTVETSAKQKDFHYSKLKRREELERKRKQKKIEWLRKMYREGMLQSQQRLSSTTTSAVQLAANEFMELSDTNPDLVEDDDVDELLSWTNALDYDEYVTDWHISASTASSDQDHAFQTVGGDPYTLTLAN